MKNMRILVVSISTFYVFAPKALFAYNEDVHRTITDTSVVASKLDGALASLGYPEGKETELVNSEGRMQRIDQWIVEGGWREDDSIDECKPELTRAQNHFHDPTKPWEEAYFESYFANNTYFDAYGKMPMSALLWGVDVQGNVTPADSVQAFEENTTGDWSWQQAKDLYYLSLVGTQSASREANFADSLRALGQVAHLIQDMSVPAHTRNDPHVFPITSPSRPPYCELAWGEELLYGFVDWYGFLPSHPWHYETYTWNNARKDLDGYTTYIANLTPIFPNNDIIKPNPNYTDVNGEPKLSPISGLFDTTVDAGSTPNLFADNVGLAEYTNTNFFSLDTIFDYPHPAKDETTYKKTLRTARDGEEDTLLYVYRNEYLQEDHPVGALKYWAENVDMDQQEFYKVHLDNYVFASYESFLIPRAIGYSASLLDYFFRGKLEITPPDRYVYAIVDGGEIDLTDNTQYIQQLKVKVRNISPDEEMVEGSLVAVAKYKKIIGYQPDLSLGSPTAEMREADFSYSTSATIPIASLSSTTAEEFTFDFTENPIPAGITDLTLQVVFKGTLGYENDTAIAVGLRDLSEPQHISIWNYTDYFQLNGEPLTAAEVRQQSPVVETLVYIDPLPFTEEIGFSRLYPDTDITPLVQAIDLPPARYSRIIVLTDGEDKEYFLSDRIVIEGVPNQYGVDPDFDYTWKSSLPTAVHQEDGEGVWQSSPVYRVRDVVQHQVIYFIRSYPGFYYIHNLPAPPENAEGPHPVNINFIQ